MLIYVNDAPVRVFNGAKVHSAILAYLRDGGLSPKTPVDEVRDSHGNRIAMDGPLSPNARIYVKVGKDDKSFGPSFSTTHHPKTPFRFLRRRR